MTDPNHKTLTIQIKDARFEQRLDAACEQVRGETGFDLKRPDAARLVLQKGIETPNCSS